MKPESPSFLASETTERHFPGSAGAGMLLVLCAALLWSTSGVFIKVLTVRSFALVGLLSALALLLIFRKYGRAAC